MAHGVHDPGAGAPAGPARRVIVLGSTGSIGTQTLEVLEHLRRSGTASFRVVGLAAGRNGARLAEQAARFGVRDVALLDGEAPGLPAGCRLRTGPEGPERLVREVDADVIVAAIVGAAGLPATLAGAELGRAIALANKETLVAAGALVVPAATASGACLLPVDSEHSAIWQALESPGGTPGASCPPLVAPARVRRVILTASGGALRTFDAERTYRATPAEALAHPTWNMGAKVTVDSASLTNKALEVIEAHWLFGLEAERIGVVVHPQSIVHSLVEYIDGSVLAQLGAPDMRGPIQHALLYPARAPGLVRRLDLAALGRLDFEAPDARRFPALDMAFEVIRRGGTAGAVFNGANEAAVEAFLAGHPGVSFGRIAELTGEALHAVGCSPLRCLADALEADREARRFVRSRLGAGVATGGAVGAGVPRA